MKKVLFLLNKRKDNHYTISKEIIEFLHENNCVVYVEEDFSKDLTNTKKYSDEDINFAIILGGDGTILNYAQKYIDKDFPFFGINLGRVGCLAEAELNDYKNKITNILNGKYFLEERNTILCSLYKKNELVDEIVAFNEVCVQKGPLPKMLLINMTVNSKNNTLFYSDGVIVSTSTGSSAYNLSSGGPLLLPTAKNFVITPVCPQLRSITSLVVNDTDIIELRIVDEKRDNYEVKKPIIVVDGWKEYDFDVDCMATVQKSEKVLKIIKTCDEKSLFEPIFKVAMSSRGMFIKSEE